MLVLLNLVHVYALLIVGCFQQFNGREIVGETAGVGMALAVEVGRFLFYRPVDLKGGLARTGRSALMLSE